MTSNPILDAGAAILRRRRQTGAGWDPGLDVDGDAVVLQECAACGYNRYPRAVHCPQCLSTNALVRSVSGQGTIWSFAVYHRAYDEAFADALPYAVALVVLDDGPQLIGAVIDTPNEEVAVGRRVTAVPRELEPGQYAVYFRVAS
jgi:uncharacterized OB-fold protein